MMLFLPTNGKNQSLLTLTISQMLNVGAELMMSAAQLQRVQHSFHRINLPLHSRGVVGLHESPQAIL